MQLAEIASCAVLFPGLLGCLRLGKPVMSWKTFSRSWGVEHLENYWNKNTWCLYSTKFCLTIWINFIPLFVINFHFDRYVSKPPATIKFRSAPSWKKNIHSKPYLFTTLVCEIFDPFTPVKEPISVVLAIPHSKKSLPLLRFPRAAACQRWICPKAWEFIRNHGNPQP